MGFLSLYFQVRSIVADIHRHNRKIGRSVKRPLHHWLEVVVDLLLLRLPMDQQARLVE